MKKEEILEKSKRENLWQDERNKQIEIKSHNYAALIGNVILLVVIFWKQVHKMPYDDLMGILGIQFAVSILYKYKNKSENKLYLIAGIMMLFAGIVYLVDFFINGVR
ncbi:DUF6442 family protein [Clostridium sp. MB40-C1]|uniref:DUF6442 family protein n=1 Tax=Clostridium sp. MB40-C1 TaxID=3070996 RepID=UPI0027E12B4A|nr:DUF6442 family protein [Clostridium sp. MB40-C1]WMJ81750.1 DUF6442 family protein [Clostridium sp. MB40-C1]